MPKFVIQIKHWLIRKLGGYTLPDKPLVIEHTVVPVVTITEQVVERLEDARRWYSCSGKEHEDYIVNALTERIAAQLKDHIEITVCNDELNGKKIYQGQIKIATKKH